MSEALAGALIGGGSAVAGAIVGAVVATLGQLAVTKRLIAAERAKLVTQLQGEAMLRAEEARRSQIREIAAEIMAITNPEQGLPIPRDRAIGLVHSIQLLLHHDGPEGALNAAINRLAMALTDGHMGMIDTKGVYEARGAITDGVRAALRAPLPRIA